MIYPDTGCLIKFYYPEPDSADVIASAGAEQLLYNALHELEIVSALEGKVFRREATPQQVAETLEHIRADINAGVLIESVIEWPTAFRLATSLAEDNGSRTRVRAIDTLHCAIAQSLGARAILTTDVRQRALAQAMNLSVLP
jgi:predicted nucleic acid-binding protein